MFDVKITSVTHLLVVTPGMWKNRLRCSKWITHDPPYHSKCSDILSNLIGHFYDAIRSITSETKYLTFQSSMCQSLGIRAWAGILMTKFGTKSPHQQIAQKWCRRWNAMINNKFRSFSTPSAAGFLKTSLATLNEIIWPIKLITANKETWCKCVVGLLID